MIRTRKYNKENPHSNEDLTQHHDRRHYSQPHLGRRLPG